MLFTFARLIGILGPSVMRPRSERGGQSIRWELVTAFAGQFSLTGRARLSLFGGFLEHDIRYKFEQGLRVRFDVVVRTIHDAFCWMSA